MKNTKLFKTFINFFDRTKGLLPAPAPVPSVCTSLIIIPNIKKSSNLLLSSNNKLSFETKFNIVKNFINHKLEFNFLIKPKLKFKVSGLLSLGPKERLLLNPKATDLSLKKTLTLHLMDYCYKLYSKNNIKNFSDLFNNIKNLLEYSNLNQSPYSYPSGHKHNYISYFSFKQHMLASDFAGYHVPIKVLLNYYKTYFQFDLEEYLNARHIPLTLILEFHLFFLAFRDIIEQNPQIFVLAANPDNPFYGEFRDFIYSILGQPNGDIIIFLLKEIICNNNNERENILIKLIPVDMKIKAQPEIKLSLFKSYICISPPLTDGDQILYFKRFLSDLKGTTNNKDAKDVKILSSKEILHCQTWAEKLESLIKSKIPLAEKQIAFDKLYIFYFLNEDLKHIIPSKLIIAIQDYEFACYYKEHYNLINLLIEQLCKNIDERLFDSRQEVNSTYIEDLLLQILDGWKIFDKNLAKKMLDNYLSAKKLFILHDVDI